MNARRQLKQVMKIAVANRAELRKMGSELPSSNWVITKSIELIVYHRHVRSEVLFDNFERQRWCPFTLKQLPKRPDFTLNETESACNGIILLQFNVSDMQVFHRYQHRSPEQRIYKIIIKWQQISAQS